MSDHAFDTDRDCEFILLANWIGLNLDVTFTEADEMADAALDVKYGGGDGE